MRRFARRALRDHHGAAVLMLLPAAMSAQQRHITWSTVVNPTKWLGDKSTNTPPLVNRATNPQVEEELPEIFANQPKEVDDYIRPDKSYFERLEDLWDWLLGFLQPVEKQVELLRSLKHDGLFGGVVEFSGWGAVFVFYGFCLRCLTLIPTLYSHRNSLRLSQINPQLSEINNNSERAKKDRTLSTADKRVIKDGYNRMKTVLYKKHKCSQWQSLVQAITAPITLSAFMAIRRLSVYEQDLEKATFLWVKDLTMPDPTYMLPLLCASLFLTNFELVQRVQRGGRSSLGIYARWGVRAACGVGVYFFSSEPSSMFAYWIGLSLAGLVQPVLLRFQPFRDLFRFPDPPQAAKSAIRGSQATTVNSPPSLYEKLLNPEVAKEKQAKYDEERASAAKSKYQNIAEFDVVFDDVKTKK